jgi:hypothetical protein
MAVFSTVPTVNTSDSWTASQHNTYIRDNFAAVWVGTTAGDLDYYTSATAKSRLGIGSANQFLYSTGSAPAWGNLSTLTGSVALFASQATGDIPYASSATAISRLAKGALYTFLRSNGTTPEYGSISYRRQGGSSTVWGTSGTSNYTPTKELIQVGVIDMNVSVGSGSSAVTFPVAYSNVPHVMASIVATGTSQYSAPMFTTLTNAGFIVSVVDSLSGTASIKIHWMARGE